MALAQTALAGAFSDPVFHAQTVFRALMDGMARPGRIMTLPPVADPPQPLGPGAGAIALALCDHDTPVWLSAGLAASALPGWLSFHTGAPLTTAKAEARFAFAGSEVPAFNHFALGTQEYPDRSTTLVIELPALTGGRPFTARGPGIDGETGIAPLGLPPVFLDLWAENRAVFPRGVDLVLCAGLDILCLPRSTRLAPAHMPALAQTQGL